MLTWPLFHHWTPPKLSQPRPRSPPQQASLCDATVKLLPVNHDETIQYNLILTQSLSPIGYQVTTHTWKLEKWWNRAFGPNVCAHLSTYQPPYNHPEGARSLKPERLRLELLIATRRLHHPRPIIVSIHLKVTFRQHPMEVSIPQTNRIQQFQPHYLANTRVFLSGKGKMFSAMKILQRLMNNTLAPSSL